VSGIVMVFTGRKDMSDGITKQLLRRTEKNRKSATSGVGEKLYRQKPKRAAKTWKRPSSDVERVAFPSRKRGNRGELRKPPNTYSP
jgi:hypothetical protein